MDRAPSRRPRTTLPGIAAALALAATVAGLGAASLGAQEREARVARGRQLFADKGCYGCHTIGTAGTPIAPDLSYAGTRYSETMLGRWLRHPAAQAATSHMPDLGLTEAEAGALAAYLASLH